MAPKPLHPSQIRTPPTSIGIYEGADSSRAMSDDLRTQAGFVTISQQLLDECDFPRTPEQTAERLARQAERDRLRTIWWASLPRRQRLRIRTNRLSARTRTQISSMRTDLAYRIAPWL